jgi:predicted dienelactone hydrolase
MPHPRLLLPIFALALAANAYEPPAPSHPVETLLVEWHDAARDRAVPAKIYFPKDAGAPCPVIIFSHGLGGSREGYQYLGEQWAGCGYVSVHLQHLGSDDSVWKNTPQERRMTAMGAAAKNLANALHRPRDVSFALDELTRFNADSASPLHRRLDLAHVGAAGHSFGGYTVMAIAGQALGPQHSTELADPRIKSVVEMSAPVPSRDASPEGAEAAYPGIKTPVFHLTGTLDDSPVGETKAGDRRVPFDHMKAADTCLLIFNGGDHMVFSGSAALRRGPREKDPVFLSLIRASTTAWWDATLRDDAAAKEWLFGGAFKAKVGAEGTFEAKSRGSSGASLRQPLARFP